MYMCMYMYMCMKIYRYREQGRDMNTHMCICMHVHTYIWSPLSRNMYRVAKIHRMPYLCRSFSAKELCDEWLFYGK